MAKDLKLTCATCFATSETMVIDGTRADDFLKDYVIPDYILVPGSDIKEVSYVPSCPVMVFINSRSGGQLGAELLVTYRSLLNENQVIDLGVKAPDLVLHQLYLNLEKHKQNSDIVSAEVQMKLRIIVAGGDGTVGWLLGVLSDLKLARPPPVATMPLGTGNNISFSFGWGKKNPGTDSYSVKAFLVEVNNAREMKIDSWHVLMRMKVPEQGSCDPIAPLELPHSLHAVHRVSQSDILSTDGFHTFRGGFWNYFSMGMDAQVSYAFHSERKLHPEKFKNQLVNQSTYAKLGLTQGWYCASLFHPSSRNIAQLAKVRVMRRSGQWEDLFIPSSIRSIVCLNLPSFSGGFNPWGTPSGRKLHSRDLTPPYVDDGLIEIVGFRNAWHGLVLLAPKGHGTRLAQANRIHFEFNKGAAEHTYMRIDGEPWKQPLPVNDDTVVVEISHFGQVTLLATPHCQSRNMCAPPLSYTSDVDRNFHNEEIENREERKKLGAATTFKIPDNHSS